MAKPWKPLNAGYSVNTLASQPARQPANKPCVLVVERLNKYIIKSGKGHDRSPLISEDLL